MRPFPSSIGGAAYVYRKPYRKHEKAVYVRFRAILRLEEISVGEIAQLIRDTLLDENEVLEFWRRENGLHPNGER
jgi:hypothetical protein